MQDFNYNENRDAWATIRGYVYQVNLSIQRWISLPENNILYLESGEDMDEVIVTMNNSNEQDIERNLKQIKHKQSNLTLNDSSLKEALMNFLEHKITNRHHNLTFSFLTNAVITEEKTAIVIRNGKKYPALKVWKDIDNCLEGELTSIRTAIIAQKEPDNEDNEELTSSKKAKKIDTKKWQIWCDFINGLSDDKLIAFIKTFEINDGLSEHIDLKGEIQEELKTNHKVTTLELLYNRLFTHVFHLLSQKGEKKLVKADFDEFVVENESEIYTHGYNKIMCLLKFHEEILEQIRQGIEVIIEHTQDIPSIKKGVDKLVYNLENSKKPNLEGILKEFQRLSGVLLTWEKGKVSYSHIERDETEAILTWIETPLSSKNNEIEDAIGFLVGEAGKGKTIILKDLANKLQKNKIPFLALKADRHNTIPTDIVAKVQELAQTYSKIVIIIDQIDALSQSLYIGNNTILDYTNLVSQLISIQSDKIRLVVSCRNFDLQNNPELNQFEKHKKWEVSLLSEETVKSILNQLKVSQPISIDLMTLLRTALHLHIFYKIYPFLPEINSIKTLKDLYDKLWEKQIKKGDKEKNTKFLTYIAKDMYEKQQSFVKGGKYLKGEFKEVADNLQSLNLISIKNIEIQFFHQTFFDYVFARTFVEEGKMSLSEDLIGKHQGLFYPSKIKQVIAYLRDYDEDLYISEMKTLLQSSNIRFHLKLLVIQQLAYIKTPNLEEEKLFKNVIYPSADFLIAFIEAIQGKAWLALIYKEKIIENGLLAEDLILKNAIWVLLRRLPDVDLVLQILDELPEFSQKSQMVENILFFIKETTNDKILELYKRYENEFIKGRNGSSITHFFEDRLSIFPDWVATEMYNIQKTYSKEKNPFGWEDLSYFWDAFFTKNSNIAYACAKKIMLDMIKYNPSVYGENAPSFIIHDDSAFIFMFYDVLDENNHNLTIRFFHHIRNHLREKAKNEVPFTKEEISFYLATKSVTCYLLAIEMILTNSYVYIEQAFRILSNKELLDEYDSHNEYLTYLYRKMIEICYPLFSTQQKEIINKLIINIKDKSPIWKNKTSEGKKYNTSFGLRLYKLLNIIPKAEIILFPIINKQKSELARRYNRVENTLPRGVITKVGQPSMKHSAYPNMDLAQWRESFLKYNQADLHSWDDSPKMEGNAEQFKHYVKQKPEMFVDFLASLMSDENIHIHYCNKGLDGLLESQYDIEQIKDVFKLFIQRIENDTNVYRRNNYRMYAVWMSRHFIQAQNIDSDIISFLLKCSKMPSSKYVEGEHAFSRGGNDTAGAATSNLLECYFLVEYREIIYNRLTEIAQSDNILSRTTMAGYLHLWMNISKEQTFQLFVSLVQDNHPQIWNVLINPLNYIRWINPPLTIQLFKEAILLDDETIRESIGVHLFVLWQKDYEECKPIIDELLETSQKARLKILGFACQYIQYLNWREKCEVIIRKYFKEEGTEYSREYEASLFLRENNKKGLDVVKYFDLLKDYTLSPIGMQRGSYFYKNLLHFTHQYPKECIALCENFDSQIIPTYIGDKYNPLNVVVEAYNALKGQKEEEEILNRAMDIFDRMLKHPNYRTEAIIVMNTL